MQKAKAKKGVFTTGEIAKMLGISPVTVMRLIDRGQLIGFRIPSSPNAPRRVERQKLIEFIKAQPNLPVPDELKDEIPQEPAA